MSKHVALGIDCGGTHTDAALLEIDEKDKSAKILAAAKTVTNHADLPSSIINAVQLIKDRISPLPPLDSVTLGTTLEINAIVQDKLPQVGLALSAGSGLDPIHFGLGNQICIVPGGLDHRGVEVTPLYTEQLEAIAGKWAQQGVKAIACVSKFSPRNDSHEQKMAAAVKRSTQLPVIMGHELSGALNFPRRVATAYYSAAVGELHSSFLDAVESALHAAGISASLRLLKADGGAITFSVSRKEPAQSILSGPAASVMGCLALWDGAASGCSLLIDIGGTTSDLALFLNGSPVVDRLGMSIKGRRTLVRSLAAKSIGIGGDSLINISGQKDSLTVTAGPVREGPAMAFGGRRPTLLDALNYLDQPPETEDRGDITASSTGIAELAASASMEADELANRAVDYALQQLAKAAYDLIAAINSKPIYTLAALKAVSQARPTQACVIGGPAKPMQKRLEKALGLPVAVSPHADVANAVGAALTLPTAQLEVYADTGTRELSAPELNYKTAISPNCTLEEVKNIACKLLEEKLAADGIADSQPEVTEADLFATLDDRGRSARDMRVTCQLRPGIRALAR